MMKGVIKAIENIHLELLDFPLWNELDAHLSLKLAFLYLALFD